MAKLPSAWWALFHPRQAIDLLDDMTQARDLMKARFDETKVAAERLLKSDDAHRQKVMEMEEALSAYPTKLRTAELCNQDLQNRIALALRFIRSERESPTRMTANRITLFNNKDVRHIEAILSEEYDPFAP